MLYFFCLKLLRFNMAVLFNMASVIFTLAILKRMVGYLSPLLSHNCQINKTLQQLFFIYYKVCHLKKFTINVFFQMVSISTTGKYGSFGGQL